MSAFLLIYATVCGNMTKKGGEVFMTDQRKEVLRTVKFVLFSFSAGIIQLASYTLFLEVCRWDAWLAHLISLILSVLWNFTLNRKFTFHSATNVPLAMLKVAAFYLVFTPLSTWWTAALDACGWNEYLIEGINMLSNLITEYFFMRFVVFRGSVDTAIKEKRDV